MKKSTEGIKVFFIVIFGLLFLSWVILHDAFESKRLILIPCVLYVFSLRPYYYFRMKCDENFRKKQEKIIAEEIKKPWYEQNKHIYTLALLQKLQILSFFSLISSFGYFFYKGFSLYRWNFKMVIIFVISLIFFLICHKLLGVKTFKKTKKPK